MFRRIGIVFLMALLLAACAPRGVDEACCVVAEADSLWQAGLQYGIDEGDSATLAQAYKTLEAIPLPFREGLGLGSPYAHACYHYGRLLRRADDPVAAMQVFISGTHSGTDDHHILGRIYSNMSDLCHLASEFPLAYDMYERSGEMYLRNDDSLLYYYDLNNMAFELAEQGKKDETFILLDSIAHNCNDRNVFLKTLETKAKLYFQLQLYDSVIYTTNVFQLRRDCVPTSCGLKARAFWHMGQVDSALYYANQVLSMPTASEQNKYNMLYIIANADSTLSNEDVLALSAQRSDIETDILIPLHSKWGLAVQLLQQDLNRKPDWRWFWGVVATLLVVGLCLWLYIFRKHKQRALLSQQVEDLTIQNEEAKDQQIKRYNDRLLRIQENCDILANSDSIMDSLQWKNYDKFCECINIHFFLLADKLKATDRLNEKEIRLCVLVLIGSFTDKQMANILYYSYNSIRSTKRTLANKLGTTSANLRSFLIEKAAK